MEGTRVGWFRVCAAHQKNGHLRAGAKPPSIEPRQAARMSVCGGKKATNAARAREAGKPDQVTRQGGGAEPAVASHYLFRQPVLSTIILPRAGNTRVR